VQVGLPFRGAKKMQRDTVINALLVIAGLMLAIALFGAGVLWKR
jgi:hypothetical protein